MSFWESLVCYLSFFFIKLVIEIDAEFCAKQQMYALYLH